MPRSRAPYRAAALRLAAVCVIVVALGSPATGAAPPKAASVDLAYDCAFPDGTHSVGLRLTATFPSAAGTGDAIKPEHVGAELTVPPDAQQGIAADDSGATVVTASADVTMRIAQGDHEAEAGWNVRTESAVPLPAEGDLVLPLRGEAPSVTVGSPGAVTFQPGGLTLQLGAASSADPMKVKCGTPTGTATPLATVEVGGAASESPAPSGSEPPPGADEGSLDVRGQGREAAPDPGEIPEECEVLEGGNIANSGCAYLNGFNNVRKLDGAAFLTTTVMNLGGNSAAPPFYCDENNDPTSDTTWYCIPMLAEMAHQGRNEFAPSEATFLSFRAIPTTATLEVSVVGRITIFTRARLKPPYKSEFAAESVMSVRVRDMRVNGQPLDLGPDCRTTEPFPVMLRATEKEYNVTFGGYLSGEATIPAFTGCGADEDLDRLLTASISGPGNYVRMTQGAMCTLYNADGCPPNKPIPHR
ncbi:DUF6801 domain-containing protein [Streptomyces sp. NPDC050418]|uniref:DUF6801 domain-containing protein n=1 Tax=Streptomyces sp. NPDC050418 TaxID=3365612 RepID=UPI00379B0C4E